MNIHHVITAFLIGSASAAWSAENLKVESVQSAPEFDALFVREKGWIGADGDYSVAISNERTLWFFSDTWLGELVGGKRINTTLVNNSVGVQSGDGRLASIEFGWGTGADGKPSAFFQPTDGEGWFWPFGGIFAAGRLHLFLWQMEKAEGPAAFGFRNVAVWHCEIANPQDSPAKWRIQQAKLPFSLFTGDRRILFGSAVLRWDDYVYVYGVDEQQIAGLMQRRMVLARTPADAVGNFDRWEFRDGETWQKEFRRVTPLAEGVATEYTVTFVPAIQKFVLVCHDAHLSPKIIARTAPAPWGPWSEPITLHTCVEATWSKNIFCYAGKAHAAISSDNELVVSYAANSRELGDVLNDDRLYWPKFLRVKLAGPSVSR